MKKRWILVGVTLCIMVAVGIYVFHEEVPTNNTAPDNESTPTPAMTDEEKAIAIALENETVQKWIGNRVYKIKTVTIKPEHAYVIVMVGKLNESGIDIYVTVNLEEKTVTDVFNNYRKPPPPPLPGANNSSL